MCTAGVGLSAFCTSLWGFALCYGIMFGLGAGLAYTVPLRVAWSHYPQHQARVTGILMMIFGYSSSVFNLMATAIVNPDNESPSITETRGLLVNHYFSEQIANRTPTMLLCLAGVYAFLAVLGVLFISEPEESGCSQSESSVTLSDFLSSTFLTLFVSAFLSVLFSMHMVPAYKIYGSEIFNDDKYLALVGAIAAFINGSSRVGWAELFARFGFKCVYVFLLFAQILASVTLFHAARTEILYLCYVVFIFANQGCHFVIFPAVFAKTYGRVKGSLLYSVLYSGLGFASLLAFVLQKYAVQSLGYEHLFWIFAGTAVISVVLAINFEERSVPAPITEQLLPKASSN